MEPESLSDVLQQPRFKELREPTKFRASKSIRELAGLERFDLADPGPIPRQLLDVPGFIHGVMLHTLMSAPYPNITLAFCGALSLQATLAGRKICDEMDNRTSLYVLALANSGVGKDHPRKVNARILQEIGMHDCVGDGFASGEGIEDRLAQNPVALFQTDEIDVLITKISKNNEARYEGIMQVLMKMATSANSYYPMRTKAGPERSRTIPEPALSIFGTAIPQNYYQAMSPQMLSNGFFARMLVLEAPRRGKGQETTKRVVPAEILDVAEHWKQLAPPVGEPHIALADAAAKQYLRDYRSQADQAYAVAEESDDQVAMAIWARAAEKLQRLALNYACSVQPKDPAVTEDAVLWAGALVNHLTRRMLFMARNHVAENQFDADCQRICRKLRESPGQFVKRSVLLKRLKVEASYLDRLIETLEQRGEVQSQQSPTPGRTGRLYRLKDW